MDVFDRIVRDHEDFRERFRALYDAADRGDESGHERLFREQYVRLVAHHQTEEEVLFTRLAREEATKALAEEAWEEHRAINAYLTHLRDAPLHVRRTAKVKVLDELVVHHLDEEEQELMPLARDVIPAETLEAMVRPFEEKQARRLVRLREQAG